MSVNTRHASVIQEHVRYPVSLRTKNHIVDLRVRHPQAAEGVLGLGAKPHGSGGRKSPAGSRGGPR